MSSNYVCQKTFLHLKEKSKKLIGFNTCLHTYMYVYIYTQRVKKRERQ